MFGVNFLENLMQVQPDIRRILISGYSDFQDVVDAFNTGVIHKFIVKPWDNAVLINLVEEQLGYQNAKRRHSDDQENAAVLAKQKITDNDNPEVISPGAELIEFHGIVTADKELQRQLTFITKVASSDAPFYINGETGTGKELVAKAIHEESRRAAGPFIAVNCANLTKDLLESQLFGHKKGAFTGANTDQVGLLASADGGTLFLDEVVEIPIELQAKLLRVLQEKEYTPIGETRPVPFDCQIISASAVSLADAVAANAFREDLRFRLEVMVIMLPPLRMRGSDISFLFNYFLGKEIERQNVDIDEIDEEVYNYITSYSWPGNVREMVNVCTYIVAMANAFSGSITVDCLPRNAFSAHLSTSETSMSRTDTSNSPSPDDVIVEASAPFISVPKKINKSILQDALEKADGNRSSAAKLLGVSRMTLYRKLKEFDLD